MLIRSALAVCVLLLPFLFVMKAKAADPIELTGNGVNCADVRSLTRIERWYWIKRLGLTRQQVAAIKRACNIR